LETDLLLKAADIQSAMQALFLRDKARHLLVLLMVDKSVLVRWLRPESRCWHQL
jgi:hypothetical protein